MKGLFKTAAILLFAAAMFITGVLYTVYHAGIEWTADTVTVEILGHAWDFPAYNEPA